MLPQALKSYPKCNKLAKLVTLVATSGQRGRGRSNRYLEGNEMMHVNVRNACGSVKPRPFMLVKYFP